MRLKGEVRGLVETRRKLEQVAEDLHGKPLVDAMRASTLLVQRDAKKLAPVDTGGLRASIASEVALEGRELVGIVGSNRKHAPYMETGTKPHFPPLAALQVWARRHGVSAFVVARAIARRGLKPRRYLQGAYEKNRAAIIRKLENAVTDIVEK